MGEINGRPVHTTRTYGPLKRPVRTGVFFAHVRTCTYLRPVRTSSVYRP